MRKRGEEEGVREGHGRDEAAWLLSPRRTFPACFPPLVSETDRTVTATDTAHIPAHPPPPRHLYSPSILRPEGRWRPPPQKPHRGFPRAAAAPSFCLLPNGVWQHKRDKRCFFFLLLLLFLPLKSERKSRHCGA